MPVYAHDPEAAPDDEFEPGTLAHLVVGNAGRVLDPRRTPVTIVDRRDDVGMFVVRLDAFEDAGATWAIPFEQAGHYQFARGARRAGGAELAALEATVARLDRPLRIEPDPEAASITARRLHEARRAADGWLGTRSAWVKAGAPLPDPESRDGDARLQADLETWLAGKGLDDLETAFAEQYVRNPGAGEIVKGHGIVLAEMGLAPYEGTIVRDPATFDGPWSRARRGAHLLERLAFVQAALRRAGCTRLVVYRGVSADGPIGPPRRRGLVSTTRSRAVGLAHFEAGDPARTAMLVREPVPVDRVVMTYLETAAMNGRYREAEVVLLAARGDGP